VEDLERIKMKEIVRRFFPDIRSEKMEPFDTESKPEKLIAHVEICHQLERNRGVGI